MADFTDKMFETHEALVGDLAGPVEDWSAEDVQQFLEDSGVDTRAATGALYDRALTIAARRHADNDEVPEHLAQLLRQLRPTGASPAGSEPTPSRQAAVELRGSGPVLNRFDWLKGRFRQWRRRAESAGRALSRIPVWRTATLAAVAAIVIVVSGTFVLQHQWPPVTPTVMNETPPPPLSSKDTPTGDPVLPAEPRLAARRPETALPLIDRVQPSQLAVAGTVAITLTGMIATDAVHVPAAAHSLVLNLVLDGDRYPAGYAAVVESATGGAIQRMGGLKATTRSDGSTVVTLRVSGQGLTSGQYVITVSGARDDGALESVANYRLSITRSTGDASPTETTTRGQSSPERSPRRMAYSRVFVWNDTGKQIDISFLSVRGGFLSRRFLPPNLQYRLPPNDITMRKGQPIVVPTGSYRFELIATCGTDLGPAISLDRRNTLFVRYSCDGDRVVRTIDRIESEPASETPRTEAAALVTRLSPTSRDPPSLAVPVEITAPLQIILRLPELREGAVLDAYVGRGPNRVDRYDLKVQTDGEQRSTSIAMAPDELRALMSDFSVYPVIEIRVVDRGYGLVGAARLVPTPR